MKQDWTGQGVQLGSRMIAYCAHSLGFESQNHKKKKKNPIVRTTVLSTVKINIELFP
jgi:hypothetical protein